MPEPRHGAGEADAERWFMRLQMGDCTSADRAAFARWRLADPLHAAAYAEVERVFALAAQAAGDPRLQAAALAAHERVARRRARHGVLRRCVAWAAVAGVVLGLGIGWHSWNPSQPEVHYATAVGETRTLTLDDGTTVVLDTDSALRVRYRRLQRAVELEKGQAQFSVARQPRRPFVVHTGLGEIRALGTRFQVRSEAEHVQVALLEGTVEVAATATATGGRRTARLSPGEQLVFDAHQRWVRSAFDPEVMQGWTDGQLLFRSRPLAEVVQEMNRYNTTRIRLGDPSLETLRISGQFYSNDPQSLILALEHGWSLRAERTARDVVLHRDD
ncbi:FecR family protein [Luteimonas sp. SDU82]|uniref:FecR family protein n=1 Tax=Luteimonas sp. SDU82 TaxID=3422592 RepID=UPI003EBF0C45